VHDVGREVSADAVTDGFESVEDRRPVWVVGAVAFGRVPERMDADSLKRGLGSWFEVLAWLPVYPVVQGVPRVGPV
jgi:hypothetical protein